MMATATTGAGSVTSLSYYLDGNYTTPLGTVTAVPYSFTWQRATAGCDVITAEATNSNGVVSVPSSPVYIKVGSKASAMVTYDMESFISGGGVYGDGQVLDTSGNGLNASVYSGCSVTSSTLNPYLAPGNRVSSVRRTYVRNVPEWQPGPRYGLVNTPFQSKCGLCAIPEQQPPLYGLPT